MAERQIIFNGPMVRAILGGRKTQTRRPVRSRHCEPQFIGGVGQVDDPGRWGWEMDTGIYCVLERGQRGPMYDEDESLVCPHGEPGDLLYVRETFVPRYFDGGRHGYRADWSGSASDCVREPKWTPSIHMPKWAARIWLRITDVRVQRVQDISEEDAIAEGVVDTREYETAERMVITGAPWSLHRLAFARTWNSIYAKGGQGWDANPWVWAITFERIER